MITAIRNTIHPRRTECDSDRRAAIERARYTVSWFMTGVRPDVPRAPETATRPGS